jgi:hypothetical protein
MSIGLLADLVRGALDAHVQALGSDLNSIRRLTMTDRGTRIARLAMMWTPVAAVCVATAMVVLDFWNNRHHYFRVGVDKNWVPFFPYDQIYDLVLHLSMLTLALAAALIFMALARRATARRTEAHVA